MLATIATTRRPRPPPWANASRVASCPTTTAVNAATAITNMTAYSTDDLDRTKVRANTTGISALRIMYIAVMAQLLENDVARSYALALLAIARGDGTIGPDETKTFQQR